jgi:hypothetical protein
VLPVGIFQDPGFAVGPPHRPDLQQGRNDHLCHDSGNPELSPQGHQQNRDHIQRKTPDESEALRAWFYAAALADPLSSTTTLPIVTIGDIAAQVTFSGLAPGFAGLYQVNALVPDAAPSGDNVNPVIKEDGQCLEIPSVNSSVAQSTATLEGTINGTCVSSWGKVLSKMLKT